MIQKAEQENNNAELAETDGQKLAVDLLDERQQRFIQLVLDITDTRSLAEKGIAVGYSGNYGYRVYNRPDVQEALKQELARENELLHVDRMRVKKSLVHRALDSRIEARDRNRAADLFLQSQGDIGSGTNIAITQVQTNATEIRGARKERLSGYVVEASELCDGTEDD